MLGSPALGIINGLVARVSLFILSGTLRVAMRHTIRKGNFPEGHSVHRAVAFYIERSTSAD